MTENIKFDSMPNFRKLVNISKEVEQKIKDSRQNDHIYRSSKPDYLSQKEVDDFCLLNVKSIIDFRSYSEYKKSKANKLLDQHYSLYKVRLPQWRTYKKGEVVKVKKIKSALIPQKNKTFQEEEDEEEEEEVEGEEDEEFQKNVQMLVGFNNKQKNEIDQNEMMESDDEKKTLLKNEKSKNSNPSTSPFLNPYEKKHFFINFFNLNYVWEVFNRIPFLYRIISLFYLLIDFILRTDHKYFVRFFARHTLNKKGLGGQYIDFINFSQASICAALKLLSDPSNLPAMLNCAHGKDRTGVVSAILLSCLGFPSEYICSDYAKSAEELKPIKSKLVEEVIGRFQMCSTFIGSDAENMHQVLFYIDEKWGSMTNYLEQIGFTIADQQKLRNNFKTYSSCSLSFSN